MAIWAPDHAQLCVSRSVAERAGGRDGFAAGGRGRVAPGRGRVATGPVPPWNGFAMYPSWTNAQDAQDGDLGT